jgi:hypothetical protein
VVKKLGLILFNILVAVAGATVYAWLVRRDGMNEEAWRRALLEGGSAGFLAGVTIGLGATLGPRPVLGARKCLKAQASMAVSSFVGAVLVQLFPKQWSEIDRVVEEGLAERGLLLGSGIGLLIGTAAQIVQIYFTRRRKAR